jgi:hypothetical protein
LCLWYSTSPSIESLLLSVWCMTRWIVAGCDSGCDSVGHSGFPSKCDSVGHSGCPSKCDSEGHSGCPSRGSSVGHSGYYVDCYVDC